MMLRNARRRFPTTSRHSGEWRYECEHARVWAHVESNRSDLSFKGMADVISGLITENWAPGAMDAASSEAEWKRRAEVRHALFVPRAAFTFWTSD